MGQANAINGKGSQLPVNFTKQKNILEKFSWFGGLGVCYFCVVFPDMLTFEVNL